jgi:hypothetical protein
MALEPTMIYARRRDPRGVVALLRTLDPDVKIDGPDDDWKSATITLTQPGMDGSLTLSFLHDPTYYDGDDWPTQRLGMQGFFGRAPMSEQRTRVLRLIGSFNFALNLGYEPDLIPEGDARLPYLAAVVRHLDGVLFETFALRDAEGRLLFALNGDFDPEAVFPTIPEPVHLPAEPEEEEEETQPPTAERVARRALALTAVTVRALLEQDDPSDPGTEEFRERILNWIDAIGITEEIEPDEWEMLQRPVGRLERQQQINATWRLEGLVVLAWALGKFDLPPHDVLVVPNDLVRALGFLDEEASRELIAHPRLRSAEELDWQGRRLLGLHWRLRDYTIRPKPMDFLAFAGKCWFGSFDLAGIRLVGDDLALGDVAISEADEEAFGTAISAARERHLASNWLHGYSRVYSRTDTST